MKTAALLAALSLTLAGCGGGADGNSATSAAPVQGKAAPAGQTWPEVVAKTAEGYRMGNPDAPIKLVEYGSRLCPACRAFATESLPPMVQNYVTSGKVSYEFREFLIHGKADLPPSLLGRCVGEAAFFPVMEQQYANQPDFVQRLDQQGFLQSIDALPPQQQFVAMAQQMGLIDFMKQRGLPEAKARACLSDMKQIDAITKQTQDKGADGTVTSTPTLILNGRKLDSFQWKDVEGELKRAGA
jgi:protein-disulfide isomerase